MRRISPKTFVSELTVTHTWAADQRYGDCFKLQFGDAQDVSLFWKNACCSCTFRSHVGTAVCCEGGSGFWIHEGHFSVKSLDATNNAVEPVMQLGHSTTGCPANNIGASIRWFVETSTSAAGAQIGQFGYDWANVTHACREARFFLDVNNAAGAIRAFLFETLTRNISFGALNHVQMSSFTDCNRGCAGTAGRLIWNTTAGKLEVDNGCAWICVGTGCAT